VAPPPAAPAASPAPLRGPTAPRGYSLEVHHPKDDPAFAFDATAVGDPSAPRPVSLPPPDAAEPRPLSRRVGPLLLAILGPVGIAVAVFMGLQRSPTGADAGGPDAAALTAADAAPPPDDAAVLVAGPDVVEDAAPAATAPDVAPPHDAAAPAHDAPAPARDAARTDARAGRQRGDDPDEPEVRDAAAATGIVEASSAEYMRRVSALMRTQHPAFLRCYQEHAPPSTDAVRVSITFHYSIRADGSASAVSVRGAPEPVNDCVADAIRALRFPTPVVVTSPILDELHFTSQ